LTGLLIVEVAVFIKVFFLSLIIRDIELKAAVAID